MASKGVFYIRGRISFRTKFTFEIVNWCELPISQHIHHQTIIILAILTLW